MRSQDGVITSRNEEREFNRLMDRTKRHAFNMAFRMTGNRADAEDLTQEAYVRAYRSFDKYNRAMPFENWFFRILSNLFVDKLRRKPKLAPISLDQPLGGNQGDDEYTLDIADEEADPAKHVVETVLDERLQDALVALPNEFREAVLLCDVAGMSYEEIAERMGTSIGTVRSRIHRGRMALRKKLIKPAPSFANAFGGLRPTHSRA